MADFIVLDTSENTQRFALLDLFGRYHVARVEDELPAVGASLTGLLPTAGSRVLVDPRGEAYRVTFDAIDCGQQATFDLLPA